MICNTHYLVSGVDNAAALIALDSVGQINNDTCTGGTGEILYLPVDYLTWEECTQIAMLTSNFLTSILLQNNCSLDSLDETKFYDLVKSHVVQKSEVFGSAIALEPGTLSSNILFAPYAYQGDDAVISFDLALGYDYMQSNVEWYNTLRTRSWTNVKEVATKTTFGYVAC